MAGGNAEAISRLIQTVAYRGRLSIVGAASREVPSISFSDIIHKNMTVYASQN